MKQKQIIVVTIPKSNLPPSKLTQFMQSTAETVKKAVRVAIEENVPPVLVCEEGSRIETFYVDFDDEILIDTRYVDDDKAETKFSDEDTCCTEENVPGDLNEDHGDSKCVCDVCCSF